MGGSGAAGGGAAEGRREMPRQARRAPRETWQRPKDAQGRAGGRAGARLAGLGPGRKGARPGRRGEAAYLAVGARDPRGAGAAVGGLGLEEEQRQAAGHAGELGQHRGAGAVVPAGLAEAGVRRPIEGCGGGGVGRSGGEGDAALGQAQEQQQQERRGAGHPGTGEAPLLEGSRGARPGLAAFSPGERRREAMGKKRRRRRLLSGCPALATCGRRLGREWPTWRNVNAGGRQRALRPSAEPRARWRRGEGRSRQAREGRRVRLRACPQQDRLRAAGRSVRSALELPGKPGFAAPRSLTRLVSGCAEATQKSLACCLGAWRRGGKSEAHLAPSSEIISRVWSLDRKGVAEPGELGCSARTSWYPPSE